MKFNRASGILLHPTSLPGSYGIGDIGPTAFQWIDFLKKTGCTLWQVLPLGPTGYGDSPYQSFSAYAGNPYLISPEVLLEEEIIRKRDLEDMPQFPKEQVDYGLLIKWKLSLLNRAFDNFNRSANSHLKDDLSNFQAQNVTWLSDFALFMAIKEIQGGKAWNQWPLTLRRREEEDMMKIRRDLGENIQRHIFYQWLFFCQWSALKKYASENEVLIIGDIPIFVAHDSSDVWAHTNLFFMDRNGNPTVVAGVPPDYFSETGQLWGNPLYRWDVHAETGYSWWLDRFRAVLSMVDIVRLDHFRGFAAYWEVPAGNPTAEIGQWVPVPGVEFFKHIKNALGDLPIIAEDLGLITPDVIELREKFELPSMKVLQFAFLDPPDNTFMPHNYPVNCVAYTGTHDNDTTWGWYQTAPAEEKKYFQRYLNTDDSDVAWDMIRSVWGSVAMYSLAPLQDLLNLGSEARMNYPGRPSGNWHWRFKPEDLNEELEAKLSEINYLYYRQKIEEAEDSINEQ
jgi:4-alpha-glucanotransferase